MLQLPLPLATANASLCQETTYFMNRGSCWYAILMTDDGFCRRNILNVRYVCFFRFNSKHSHYVFTRVTCPILSRVVLLFLLHRIHRIVPSSLILARNFSILHSAKCNFSVDVHSRRHTEPKTRMETRNV